MKKMKKVVAMLLALAMVMGMSLTAFADPGNAPSPDDTAKGTVLNVDAGATVTAYHIVQAKYEDNGVTGYQVITEDGTVKGEPVEGINIADPKQPTSEEITNLATAITANDSTVAAKLLEIGAIKTLTKATAANEDGTYNFSSDELTAGYWLVIVSGAVENVYNPMLLGIAYNVSGSDNSMADGTIDSNSDWDLDDANVYAKSTKPTLKKTIVDGDGKTESGAEVDNGNDVAINDDVNYKIETVIPSYSAEYKEVVVKINDTLSAGLTLKPETAVVKVDNKDLAIIKDGAINEDSIDATGTDETKPFKSVTLDATTGVIEIEFCSAYVLANAANDQNVEVTYTATLNENAAVNFDPNTNTAKLVYSNDPNSSETGETDPDDEGKTYTYTFAIGASLTGSTAGNVTTTTEEVVKIDEDGNIISKVETVSENKTEGITEVLTGATFTLYKKNADGTKGDVAGSGETDEKGRLVIAGLDAGEYLLVETGAPSGYQIDTTEHPVKIEAFYNENGTLATYTIEIDEKVTNTYVGVYEKDEIKNVTVNGGSTVNTTNIVNTKLASLPSTGGMGTMIFTIGGCLIMIIAAGLFFASRRKSAK